MLDLIKILEECKQKVDPYLKQLLNEKAELENSDQNADETKDNENEDGNEND